MPPMASHLARVEVDVSRWARFTRWRARRAVERMDPVTRRLAEGILIGSGPR